MNLTREQQLILFGLIAALVIGLLVTGWRQFFEHPRQDIVIEQSTAAQAVVVHLTGAVNREGVYRLQLGDRLLDVLTLAGGARPTADLSTLNLAEPLKDGAKIVIPNKTYLNITNNPVTDVVSLNSANEEQLDTLPGIGKSTAKQIIDYRQKHGSFTKVEQLLEIPRFGKAKLERIKNSITI